MVCVVSILGPSESHTLSHAYCKTQKDQWLLSPKLIPRFGRRDWCTQMQKLGESQCEVLEELVFVFCIYFDPFFKNRISNQNHLEMRMNRIPKGQSYEMGYYVASYIKRRLKDSGSRDSHQMEASSNFRWHLRIGRFQSKRCHCDSFWATSVLQEAT